MRYTTFPGLSPKLKPQDAGAQVAHNVDLYSGALRPMRAPVAVGQALDVYGEPIKGARKLYKASGLWVGFPEFTWVIPDPVGALEEDRFIYVQDGGLYWQNASGVLNKRAPIRMGTERPCEPPTAMMLADIGCLSAAPPMECVTLQDGECPPIPAQPTNYVYTWVKFYGDCTWRYEESAPSMPLQLDVLPGDAVALSCPALPDGVDAVRWYREIAGEAGSIYLYAGESMTPGFVDALCPEELGEPLRGVLLSPPPDCIEGVAVVGDAVTLVWNGKHIWASDPHSPHGYDLDSNQYDLPFEVVGISSIVKQVEQATTYDAHVMTTGKPYIVEGGLPERLTVREVQAWHPCVARETICDMQSTTGYASPYGFVAFSGNDAINIIDGYFTEHEWLNQRPQDMRAAWWHERLWIGYEDRDGYVVGLDVQGGMRPKNLTTHGVRMSAVHAAADSRLHMARPGSADVHEWGRGAPMWMKWRSPQAVQSGLWKPSAVKVVSDMPRRRHDEDEAYAALAGWAHSHPTGDVSAFVQEHPQYRHLLAQMQEYAVVITRVFRDEKLVYTRKHRDSAPLRIPRTVRALEWSVQVEGYSVIREVHIQTSMADLSQEGGHA